MRVIQPRARRFQPPERFVYFIQGELTRRIKIGLANDPQCRLKEMRVGSPDKLTALGCIASLEAVRLERDLHDRFHHLREHGEWFREADDLLAFIAEAAIPFAPTYMEMERERRIVEAA